MRGITSYLHRLALSDALTPFSFPARLTPLSAWHGHIPFAMYVVSALRPGIIVELGVAAGDSYCAFCQAVKELRLDTRCFGVDSWEGDPHQGFYGTEVLEDLRAHHDPRYGHFSTLVRSTFDEALDLFQDGTIDLLHIDGYHTYEAVRHDFERWLSKMSRRGVVLLHDTAEYCLDFGVWRLWDELKARYPHFEFLHGHGLGLLAVGNKVPEGLQPLLSATPEQAMAVRALFAHLGAQVEATAPFPWRVEQPGSILGAQGSLYALAAEFLAGPRCQVSIVIPVHNNLNLTKTCLDQLWKNSEGIQYEVIVVDNGSTDGTREFLVEEQRAGRLRAIFNNANLGFARACNIGAARARGKYLVFLNNDTEPQSDWLRALVGAAEENERIAIVGAKLLYPDGTVQHAGVVFRGDGYYPIAPVHIYRGAPGGVPHINRRREFQVVTGACILVRRDAFLALGGFDEAFRNGCEDVDFCLRARDAGYRVVYESGSVVVHHESRTEGRHSHEHENLVLLHRKWLGKVKPDLEDILQEDGFASVSEPPVIDVNRPGCTIIIVTHNSLFGINACLHSLEETVGAHDRVILIDNASDDGTREFLQIWTNGRANVTLVLNDLNKGFPAAVNQGIYLSSEPYIVLLNPDVVVSRGWLERLVAHFADPQVAAVGPVSDFAAGPQKYRLYLGAVSSPERPTTAEISDLLHARNRGRAVETALLTGFCLALRRSALEEIGMLDEHLFFGNDDLDLCWRLRECGYRLLVAADVFVHHLGRASAPGRPDERSRLIQESTDALMEKLIARYGRGNVPPPEELWGIAWFKPSPKYATAFREPTPISTLTSIVIPVHNHLAITRQCLQSIFAFTPEPYELIIVDNGSDDGTEWYLEELAKVNPRVTVIRNPEDVGFPLACNQGIVHSRGDAVLILNNDTVVNEGWLRRLHRCLASEPDVGLVGPVSNYVVGMQYLADCPYHTMEEMAQFARRRAETFYGLYADTNRITGLCMLMRRSVVEKIGGFDPRFSPGNFEDDDFCLRARIAGFRVKIALDTFIHHFGNRTFLGRGIDYEALMNRNLSLFLAKWELPAHINLESFYAEYAESLANQPFDAGRHYVPLMDQEVVKIISPSPPPSPVEGEGGRGVSVR